MWMSYEVTIVIKWEKDKNDYDGDDNNDDNYDNGNTDDDDRLIMMIMISRIKRK